MHFSSLIKRIAPPEPSTAGTADHDGSHTADARTSTDPWAVHYRALERISAGDDIIVLSIGQEVDEQTSQLVVDTAIQSLQQGRHHYADVRGEPKLRAAIAGYHKQLTGQSVQADAVTVTSGAQNALFSLAQVLLEPGDEVLLSAPWYTTYENTFSVSGASVRSVQTTPANEFRLDAGDLLSALTDTTRAIVINAPGNPHGHWPDQASWESLVRACIERNIWLILDAVYLDIVERDALFLPHAITGANQVLITIGSLSKSHRMTGWRLGWAIGPAPLASHLGNLNMCMHYGLPPFIMDAAVTALTQAAATPTTVRRALAERRSMARSILTGLEPVRLLDAGRSMFMLLDVSELAMDANAFAHALLEAESVAVLPCNGFGPGGEQLVRIGLCVDDEQLHTACDRIQHFIQQLNVRPLAAPGSPAT